MTADRRRAETGKDNKSLDRSRIAQAVFAAAEAVGISDRSDTERLAEQIIARLERDVPTTPTLPGMEDLVGQNQPKPSVKSIADIDIRAMVEEILAQGKEPSVSHSEAISESTPTTTIEPEGPPMEEEPFPVEVALAGISDNAQVVLERRYLRKDAEGNNTETVDEMFRRVARNIASAELQYDDKTDTEVWKERFYKLMTSLEFLPNSPTLMNAGTDLQQLSACFVLPIEDSLSEIFESVKHAALIHQSGGGTGFSFSRLRPKNDVVKSTGGVASGPISFMKVFDSATETIKQGGKRRGANMGILHVAHPDVMDFIASKQDSVTLQNFNISVAASDEFIRAVEEKRDYDLINPRTGKADGQKNAREVFERIVDGAWHNGDPGLVFIDRINATNPTPHLGDIESTNPCGEQPLLPYESCNLGSINLARMLINGENPSIDWEKMRDTVHLAVRFLDNVIDVNHFPLEQIEEMTRTNRKIGLGVMGFADMLIALDIPYDSNDALQTAERVMKFISDEATAASVKLAEDRGVFPSFSGSVYDRPGGPRLRNATLTTIAPTGTLSIIAGCSSGIEPLFALAYRRETRLAAKDEDGNPNGEYFVYNEVNHAIEELAKRDGFYSDEWMEELAQKGRLDGMKSVPEAVKRVFVTAHDVSPEWHVRMQAAFQKYIDNAVSKTINFPNTATREDIEKAYLLAFNLGCKGITVYRDASRDVQILSVPKDQTTAEEGSVRIDAASGRIMPRTRPTVTTGQTVKVSTGCGNLYVTVNSDEEGICEVFSTLGKAGGCAAAQSEAISRLISLTLRSGVEPESVMEQLQGIRCPSISWDQGHAILSCPDALATVLQREIGADDAQPTMLMEGKAETFNPSTSSNPGLGESVPNLGGQCPECSSLLVYQEGCFICRACGYTKCG